MNRGIKIKNIPCHECITSCCSEFTVFLSPCDMFRIHKALKLEMKDFITATRFTKENLSYSPYAFSLGGKERYLLSLKRKRNHCIFLMRIGKQGRCGIHGFRPNVCRSYPFSSETGSLKRASQMICPTAWTISKIMAAKSLSVFSHMKNEFFSFQAFLDTWHAVELPKIKKNQIGKIESANQVFMKFLDFLFRMIIAERMKKTAW